MAVVAILFNSMVASVFIFPPSRAGASSYSGELNDIPDIPLTTTLEYGIWVDRATIILFNSTDPAAENLPNARYEGPRNDKINPGPVTYNSGCRSLDVDSNQATATLTKCGGDTVDVTLLNARNATIDGYSNGDEIMMPRFVDAVDGCSAFDSGTNYRGRYRENGEFLKNNASGTEYAQKNPSDARTTIYNFDTNGNNRLATGKQKHTADCNTLDGPNEKTINYGPSGSDGGRELNYLKGYTKTEVSEAVTNVTDEFNSQRYRIVLLNQYFDDNPSSVDTLIDCGTASGAGTSRNGLILYLVNNYDPDIGGGTDPFVDCMLRELGDDTDFATALDFQFQGDYDADLIADASDDCGAGGIPIISDIACWLVGWVFDALNAGFTAVIDYLAAPPDIFNEQNSTLEQSMNNLKNIANLIFVIAFLFVVFQYMTNINVVDAYFVKKFIPRLVIAVILVQASFFIVSELNYFFYDLGKSIQTIVFQGNNVGDLVVGNGAATLALATGLVLGPAMVGILLVVGIILLLVLLITMIVLGIRYILIIILAILAPIAFAALAIPQLEGMTKKWFNMYIKLLLMYPIIMFFLAGSAVVAASLSGGGIILQVVGLIAAFLPFIILPFTFKFAGGIMGTVSAKLGNLGKKGAKMGVNQGKKAYGNSQYGMARAKEKDMKKGIKADRAANTASSRLTRKMDGTMSPWARRRTFGSGATDAEVDKYRGVFEDRETKRKKEEAEAALATKLRAAPNQKAAVAMMDSHYREAMARKDSHAAAAAYDQLVGAKANAELERIQADAVSGIDSSVDATGNPTATHGTAWRDTGRAAYNKQQGDNYGKLGEFAPHLRGDVNSATSLNDHRKKALEAMSNDALSTANKDTWQTYSAINAEEAAARYVGIHSSGGGAATKLSPEAKAILAADPGVTAKINATDSAIEAAFAGTPSGPGRDAAIKAAKAERDKYKNALT